MIKRTLPALLFAALGLAACKDSTGNDPSITNLEVEPSTYYLGVGDTVRMVAVGTQESDGENIIVSPRYSSTNTSVATVSSDGKVTAVSVGTARIVGREDGLADTATINVIADGANFRTFNVESTSFSGCEAPQYHLARLVASTAHVLLYEDTQNPAGGFTLAQYQAIADEFEAVGYQTDVVNFGTPTDLDKNGKVVGLFTRAVNELTPSGVPYVYGGFFYSRDLFPRNDAGDLGACPTSNVAEMFYLLAPDPNGTIHGNRRSVQYVLENTLSTLPHEMQHLINAGRRYLVSHADVESVWLDEGLSHVAEELAYYAKSGYGPRQNLNAAQVLGTTQQANTFAEYQDNNLGRLSEYLSSPQNNSPIADNDELATRGATWWLLRYLADRKGGTESAFWKSLVATTDSGYANLQTALGADPAVWARDWAVTTYTDDALATEARFQEPSWNHRNIYVNGTGGHVYPLRVQTLPAGNTPVVVKSFSAAYLKFGVAPTATADVRFTAAGAAQPGACTPTALAVGQVQQVTMGAGVGFCLAGGATGAEYVAIPFYGSSSQDATISLSVSAAGVIPPVGPPNPIRSSAARALFPLDGVDPQTLRGGGLELELRLRERRIADRLRGRLTSGVAPRRTLASVEGPAGVSINIVRTK